MHRRLYLLIVGISVFCGSSVVWAGARSTPTKEPKPADSKATEAASITSESANKPQVEVFIPSVAKLCDAAARSKTAALYRALSAVVSVPRDETGEGLDFEAILKLLSKVESWPNTAVTLAIYTQDREGRSRWLVKVDWPVEKLASRLRDVLEDRAAKDFLKNVELKEDGSGGFRLELPEMLLAVVRESGEGSMIASSADVKLPDSVFGQETVASKSGKKKKPFLAYCSLNLDAGSEDEKGSSVFSGIAGVDSIRYVLSLNKKNEWSEQFGVTWNPMVGAVLKLIFQKVKEPFDCPKEAYATAVFNTGMGEGMADLLSGLPFGAIGSGAESEVMFAAVPGSGFMPIPDVFFVLRANHPNKSIEAIREAIEKETKQRAEEDQPPRWKEANIDGKVVFWRDPAADGVYGLMPMTMRSVVFFDGIDEGDDAKDARLVICMTTTWADDAVRRWADVSKETVKLPVSKKVHWQGRINWRRAYALAQPYLGVLAGFMTAASMPPDAESLGDALADSDVQIQVALGGLRVRHTGPVPLGAAYVPAVAGMALASAADASSEAAREQAACRNLRVLYYQAKLFKKDYGRWPANVAELDGYVDFASHWDLLYMRPRDRSFGEGLVKTLFASDRKKATAEEDAEEKAFDDSLYVIEWSKADDEWQLMFHEDEFNLYKNIYIDAAGEIHRVPKEESKSAAAPVAEVRSEKKNDDEREKKQSEEPKKKPKPVTKRKKKVLL